MRKVWRSAKILPTSSLIARAEGILSGLENESASGRLRSRCAPAAPELPLFEENPVLRTLKLLNPDTMTPLEALAALAALKKQL